jgi:hypothetical protein
VGVEVPPPMPETPTVSSRAARKVMSEVPSTIGPAVEVVSCQNVWVLRTPLVTRMTSPGATWLLFWKSLEKAHRLVETL